MCRNASCGKSILQKSEIFIQTLSFSDIAFNLFSISQDCSCLRMIHCYDNEAEVSPDFATNIRLIDEIYPKIRIDLVLVRGPLSPELVAQLSHELGIPRVCVSCNPIVFTNFFNCFGFMFFCITELNVSRMSSRRIYLQSVEFGWCTSHYSLNRDFARRI